MYLHKVVMHLIFWHRANLLAIHRTKKNSRNRMLLIMWHWDFVVVVVYFLIVLTTDYCWRSWTCRIATPYKFYVD